MNIQPIYIILFIIILVLILQMNDSHLDEYENFWVFNQPTRFTRNQSYDLRGDPVRIVPQHFMWNNSPIAPHSVYY